MVITRTIALERVLGALALEGYNVVLADVDPVGTNPDAPRLVLTPLTPRVAVTAICNTGGGKLTLRGPQGQRVVIEVEMHRQDQWPLEGILLADTDDAAANVVGVVLNDLYAYMGETDELMDLDAERESRREAQAAVDKLNGALAEQHATITDLREQLAAMERQRNDAQDLGRHLGQHVTPEATADAYERYARDRGFSSYDAYVNSFPEVQER